MSTDPVVRAAAIRLTVAEMIRTHTYPSPGDEVRALRCTDSETGEGLIVHFPGVLLAVRRAGDRMATLEFDRGEKVGVSGDAELEWEPAPTVSEEDQ